MQLDLCGSDFQGSLVNTGMKRHLKRSEMHWGPIWIMIDPTSKLEGELWLAYWCILIPGKDLRRTSHCNGDGIGELRSWITRVSHFVATGAAKLGIYTKIAHSTIVRAALQRTLLLLPEGPGLSYLLQCQETLHLTEHNSNQRISLRTQ